MKLTKKTQKRLRNMREIMGFSTYDKMLEWILDSLESKRLPQ